MRLNGCLTHHWTLRTRSIINVHPALFPSDFYRDKRWCFKSTDVSWMLLEESEIRVIVRNVTFKCRCWSWVNQRMRFYSCWGGAGVIMHVSWVRRALYGLGTFSYTSSQERTCLYKHLAPLWWQDVRRWCSSLSSSAVCYSFRWWRRTDCLPDELRCCNMIVEHCFEQWVFYILSHPLLSVFL